MKNYSKFIFIFLSLFFILGALATVSASDDFESGSVVADGDAMVLADGDAMVLADDTDLDDDADDSDASGNPTLDDDSDVNQSEGDNESSNESNPYSIITEDLTARYKQDYFEMMLVDEDNQPLSGENVSFIICSKEYFRVTDQNGIARLKINLDVGDYTITSKFADIEVSNNIHIIRNIVNIKIIKTTFVYGQNNVYEALVTNSIGTPIPNYKISFTVSSKEYIRKTDENGIARLNIRLGPGIYTVRTFFKTTPQYKGLKSMDEIIVNGTKLTASNIKEYYGFKVSFKVNLKNYDGSLLPNRSIIIKMTDSSGNVKNYNVKTDSRGNAYLNLTKPAIGKYNLNYSYAGDENTCPSSGKNTITIVNQTSLKLLGSDSNGKVELLSVIGNPYSKIRIAYIVGLHVRESQIHNEFYKLIQSKTDLNYSYYIYRITLKKVTGDYSKDRMAGQLLAKKYIVPHATKQKYDLAVDVHSTSGISYKYSYFIHVPKNKDKASLKYAYKTINAIKSMESNSQIRYWSPDSQTSPPYLTLPLINSGTPTIIFETLSSEKVSRTKYRANLLIKAVDTLFG